MSDIVERLQAANEWMRAPDWNDNLDDLELVSWLNRRPAGGFQAAIDEITRLTAEVERLRSLTVVQESLIRKSEAVNEKLRAALELFECDCEGEELCINTDNCRNFIARAALS